MSLFSSIRRAFSEKADGADGFKFCEGDDVVVRINSPEKFVPAKVSFIFEDGVANLICSNETGQSVVIFADEGDIYDPETTKVTSGFVPPDVSCIKTFEPVELTGTDRFIDREVAVQAGWPTYGIVKARIKEVVEGDIITAVDQAGNELQVTLNRIRNIDDVEITHDVFAEAEADASCFTPPEVGYVPN